VSDSALKDALVDFEIDFERAVADLETAIADIVGIDEDAESDILVKGDDGITRVDASELQDLLERLADAAEVATSAFREFDGEVARALRSLKRALARETAEG
jgi:hypothetical protein